MKSKNKLKQKIELLEFEIIGLKMDNEGLRNEISAIKIIHMLEETGMRKKISEFIE